MWFEINGFDRTALVDHSTVQLSSSTSDPLPSLSFEVTDIGSQLQLAVGQAVTVWDETGSGTTIAPPSRNLLLNELMYSSGGAVPGNWTQYNYLTPNPFTYNGFFISATFNNNTYTAPNNFTRLDQDCGYTYFQAVYPGQSYMASCVIQGSGTISNIQAFIQLTFQDVNHNQIGMYNPTYYTPTTSQQTMVSQAVAPAGARYVRVSLAALATVSGNNSGTISFIPHGTQGVNCEPMLFQGQYLADGTPVTYPTPDTNPSRTDCIYLPDQTCVRMRWLFNGYIKNLKVTYDGDNRTYQVDCLPLGDIIDNGAIITASYENTTDQNIINNLISTYFSGTLSSGQQNDWLPHTTVQFGQNISSVAFADTTMRDVMNQLSDATGFIYYVDEYNYLWYNDTPFNYATITVNVEGADYITKFPPQNYQVEYDGSQLRNSVKVLGGQFQTIETDVFSGDGTTKTFTLGSTPAGMSNITIGGSTYAPTSSNKIGVKGQDTLGSGGIVVLYDKSSTSITFQTAPASGTNNLLITYPTYKNVAIQVEDNQSLANYMRRFYAKVTDTAIADSTTAQTRGIAEVGKYSEPAVILTFDLSSEGAQNSVYIPRGTTVLVSSALDGFSSQAFVVQQVSVKSVGGGVNIYSYTAGVYRPSMLDSLRNTHKALQSNTSGGNTPILLTVEMLQENLYYSDSITTSIVTAVEATYDSSVYGFSSFN